jgi:2-dehydro-3-deoxyphosphogluconate aldolase/(4S)-4-hydroxy-2-oxoglutarate aldolase
MLEILKQNKIVAIMRSVPMEKALEYARAITAGGISAIEVALNSDGALEQISLLKAKLPQNVSVGAGTVITVQKARDAVSAGADFLLSPSTNEDVLAYCAENAVKLLPGVMTPTDVSVCVRHGFTVLKLFPAGDLPKFYIKSLKGPFDSTQYVAVGGVSPENVIQFLKAGFIGAGIGSNLVPKQLVEQNDWKSIEETVRKLTQMINGEQVSK